MRVNPQYLDNVVGALDQTSATQQQLTEELSNGTRVQQISDDPTAVAQNVTLSASIASEDQYSQTAATVQGTLQVTDTVLGSVVTQLTSALSIATEGDNGTLNQSDEQSISTQLTGIRDEVLSLANTEYQGQYLFSGSVASQPFSLDSSTTPASVTYNGDSVTNSLTTPNGQTVALNVPGNQLFTSSNVNVLGALNQLIADYSSGNLAAAQTTTGQIQDAINYVGQQRVVIDNSLSRLTTTQSFAQTESTQLQSVQTNLMQADLGQVSTQLKNAETQQAALTQVIASLGNNSLFNALAH